ncbi:hypothetical protein V6N11_066734 [Hibiscus sabdariffa]|uniref:F-box domain-containing protein n=1 Tax=Hibiscus sabdariffa TaxID=183260 RepID=A0ABR2SNQ6_9ROSI
MQGLSKTGRSDVPEVLVFEILHRLHVKSLTRFRCVCKPWSSSFQTPLFITKHHNHHLRHNNLKLLLKHSHGNTRYDTHYFSQLSTDKGHNFSVKQTVHLPFFENFLSSPQAVGPCNGILCLNDSTDKVALWNPSTRGYYLDLLDFNGLLGALLPQGEGTEQSFDLWVMNGSWTKQFTIDSVPGVERALGF